MSFKVLYIGVGTDMISHMQNHLVKPDYDKYETENFSVIRAKLESGEVDPYALIFCGTELKNVSIQELGQLLRYGYEAIPAFLITTGATKFNYQDVIKNGFAEVFVLPLDMNKLENCLTELAQEASFHSVKIFDLKAGDIFEFDIHIFMPVNKKYVKYFFAGVPVDVERLKRLKSQSVPMVFVPKERMKAFYKYMSSRLFDIDSGTGLSASERQSKLEASVRGLVMNVFEKDKGNPFEAGRKKMEDLNAVVNEFILKKDPGDWYQTVLANVGSDKDPYAHATRVSTLAALFSLALNIGKPAELSAAGVFHDIGIASLPVELFRTKEELWTTYEWELFHLHPELSIKYLKEKKMMLPGNVEKIILQHHENWDGTGYPKKMNKDKIIMEAQLLRVADEFDYLTRYEANKKVMKPIEAIKDIQRRNIVNPTITNNLALMFAEGEKNIE
jgi:HD-GYP domain-containing protein (c-di-GMP phosphodiesterase class II)